MKEKKRDTEISQENAFSVVLRGLQHTAMDILLQEY